MSGVARVGRIIGATLCLAGAGYWWLGQPARGASITVQLPPARPYVPQPAFSFGSNPRTATNEDRSR